MKTKNQLKLIQIRDWKFWYKLLAGIAVIAMVLAVYIQELTAIANLKQDVMNWFKTWTGGSPEDLWKALNEQFGTREEMNWISIVPSVITKSGEISIDNVRISAGYGEYTIANFSFFTILSNIAVGLWFLVAAFKPLKEGKKGLIGYEPSLMVTTAITVTMLIWLTALMPGNVMGGKDITWFRWFAGITQHVVFPLLLIFYICLFWKPDHIFKNKEYMKKGWWKIVALILIYGVYILIRGELRYQGDKPHDTQYPYFFLRIHDAKLPGLPGPGWMWFLIIVAVIIGICLGFSIAYNTIVGRSLKYRETKHLKK